jgi:hypothetical protein
LWCPVASAGALRLRFGLQRKAPSLRFSATLIAKAFYGRCVAGGDEGVVKALLQDYF